MNAVIQTHPRGATRAADATEQYLTFVLAGDLYAIPILAVQEIRGWEKVSQVPRAPRHVLGVTNLRGTMVPVLDVRSRLAMAEQATTPTTVVIVVRVPTTDGATATVGCVVDAVSDVVDVVTEHVRPAPDACGSVETHFVNGVYGLDERLVMLLDLPRLIDVRTAVEAAAGAPSQAALYTRLGGDAALTAAVDLFYGKVIGDPLLAPFFSGLDMERQKSMQRAFLTMAFGGPGHYTGRGMRAAHAGAVQAGLADAHFDAVMTHLGDTLRELGVPDELIAEAAGIAESVRPDVLGR